MKIKILAYSLLGSLFFLPNSVLSNDSPSPYMDAFDASIYDQTTLKRKFSKERWENLTSLNDREIINDILGLLIEKKIEKLEIKLFPMFNKELDNLKRHIHAAKPPTINQLLKTMGSVLSSATSLALFGLTAAGASAVAGAGLGSIHDFWDPTSHQLNFEKMRSTLENKKKDLIEKIVQENISDLEFTYILRKRFYPPDLQITIEKSLIGARNPGLFPTIDSRRVFLQNCLNFPIQKKIIPTNPYFWDLDNLSDNMSEAKKELCSYHKKTRDQFKKLIVQLIFSSKFDKQSSTRAFYVRGELGTGKTTAGEAIARHLGVPFFTTNIRTGEDISQSSLEGQGYASQKANLGHIAQALLTGRQENQEDEFTSFTIPNSKATRYPFKPEFIIKVQTRKMRETYKNTIIILNDFDRLLLDSRTSTQTLAMLLDYLDPKKATFFSHYFDQSLPIEDLIFIINANNEIPKPKPYQISNASMFALMKKVLDAKQSGKREAAVISDKKSLEFAEESDLNRETVRKASSENDSKASSSGSAGAAKETEASLFTELAKLQLNGQDLQNQEEAKKKAKENLEKAKKLGNQEAHDLLEAMNFVCGLLTDPIAQQGIIKTNSDPFKALRDRVKEIKCKGLENNAKQRTISDYLKQMIEKYNLEIDEEQKKIIVSKTENISSIRGTQKILEDEIITIKILRSENLPFDRDRDELNPQGAPPIEQADAQNASDMMGDIDSFGKYRRLLIQQTEQVPFMDSIVQKEVCALHEFSEVVNSLVSLYEPQQIDAINSILGVKYLVLQKSGLIQGLWKSKRIRTGCVPESEFTLGALENRMKRFESNQQQSQIFIYHLQLARLMATKLLQLEKTESPYKKLSNDIFQKKNLLTFCNHLEVLDKTAEALIRPFESSQHSNICKETYKEYTKWFNIDIAKRMTSAIVLKDYYQIP